MTWIEQNVLDCEIAIGYPFKDKALLKEALTHSSCANTRLESNERLEFLGDATLGLVISNLLFHRFPGYEEGELSQLKSAIVSRKTCFKVAKRLGLDKFLFRGKGLEGTPDSLVSNVMESVIGAVFLDGGYEEARLFIEERFSEELEQRFSEGQKEACKSHCPEREQALEEACHNYKSLLQTYAQRAVAGLIPTYQLLEETGPSHNPSFKVAVKIGKQVYAPAWGKSKKDAEQRAAHNALRQIHGESIEEDAM